MKFFEKIKAALLSTTNGEIKDKNGLYFYVKCAKCGAPVRIRADKFHDLQRDMENGGFILRKEIMDGSCFQLMYATIRFDANYRILEQEIEGGEFITWETYQALAHPQAAPR